MDWGQIIFAFLVGVLATIIGDKVISYFKKRELKKIYKKIVGTYECYGFEPKDNNKKSVRPEDYKSSIEANGSIANIDYKGGKRLFIRNTDENGLVWEGDILMDLETFGTVAWKYIGYPTENGKETHRSGFKRIIVSDNNTVYLIGDIEEGYGWEILKRKFN